VLAVITGRRGLFRRHALTIHGPAWFMLV